MSISAFNFSSVSGGPIILLRQGQLLTYSITGTFVGTLQLVKSVDGGISWEILRTKTAAVSNEMLTIDNKAESTALVRLRCTAYTSGTALTTIGPIENKTGLAALDRLGVFGQNRKIRTIIPYGDSRMGNGFFYVDGASTNRYFADMGLFTWAQAIAKADVTVPINAGISGETVQQIYNRLPIILAAEPDAIIYSGSYNDTINGTGNVANLIDTIQATFDGLRRAGIYNFCIANPPPISGNPTAHKQATFAINSWMRNYFKRYPYAGVYVDINKALADPATGLMITNGYHDNVHLSNYGACLAGYQFYPYLANKTNLVSLPENFLETPAGSPNSGANIPGSLQLLSNPLMQGTGGSAGTGNSGTVPTGFSGSRTGTSSCVFSIGTGADLGNKLIMTCTGAADNEQIVLSSADFATSAPSGGTYFANGIIRVTAQTNLSRVWARIIIAGATITYVCAWGTDTGGVSDFALPAVTPYLANLYFQTPEITTAEAASAAVFYIIAEFEGAGSAVIEIERCGVWRSVP